MHRSRDGGCLECATDLCCCIFTCWVALLCTLLGILFISLAIIGIVLIFFKPQIPSYSIDRLNLTSFEIRTDGKLYSEIGLVMKADNPNKDIAMEYEDNHFTLAYLGSDISSGSFTPFLQPGKNITMISMVLKGASEFGPKMQVEYSNQDKAGHIPLLVRIKVPVRVLLYDMFRVKRFTIDANCTLEVDHLKSSVKPNILKSDFTYAVAF